MTFSYIEILVYLSLVIIILLFILLIYHFKRSLTYLEEKTNALWNISVELEARQSSIIGAVQNIQNTPFRESHFEKDTVVSLIETDEADREDDDDPLVLDTDEFESLEDDDDNDDNNNDNEYGFLEESEDHANNKSDLMFHLQLLDKFSDSALNESGEEEEQPEFEELKTIKSFSFIEFTNPNHNDFLRHLEQFKHDLGIESEPTTSDDRVEEIEDSPTECEEPVVPVSEFVEVPIESTDNLGEPTTKAEPEPEPEHNYKAMKVEQLRILALQKGLTSEAHSMKKRELIELLEKSVV